MHTVTITIRNQKLELFVEKIKGGYEVWAVGIIKGQRILIDHHLTHDDLETRLEYAQPEDLIWRGAARSEIPSEKYKKAIELEKTIEQDVFWDGIDCNLSAIHSLDRDRKTTAAAKKAILGRWTDGVLTFSTEPDHKLQWLCADNQHWLNRSGDSNPGWWNFSSRWELHLMNMERGRGTHVSVLHVDDKELHVRGGHLNRIVHVFSKEET
jgi:hypothetical protein